MEGPQIQPLNKIKPGHSVVVAHPNTLMRESIASILREGGFRVLGQAGKQAGLLRLVAQHKPDIVLVHWNFADDVQRAISETASRAPDSAVVILTQPHLAETMVQAIPVGARGCLSVNLSPAEFAQSLTLLARGDVVVSCDLADAVRRELSGNGKGSPLDCLSEREKEVLVLVGQGSTNREIAEELYISEHTVKVHLRTILAKLNLRNRQQAAAYAMKMGLVKDLPA